MTVPEDDAVDQESADGHRPRRAGGSSPDDRPGPFSPRWGRLGVASIGAVALCVVPLTAILALLGVASPLLIPLWLVVAGAAVGLLRVLAIRDRYARVDRAFAEAMTPVHPIDPEPTVVTAPTRTVPPRPTVLFDAEDATPRPASPMTLRTAALASAHGASAIDVRGGHRPQSGTGVTRSGAAPAASRTWAPVEIPRPTYVGSAKAERPAPAPLDLPEAPRASTRTPIKTAEAAARRAGAAQGTEPATEVPRPRIDLDNVLQRRRA